MKKLRVKDIPIFLERIQQLEDENEHLKKTVTASSALVLDLLKKIDELEAENRRLNEDPLRVGGKI